MKRTFADSRSYKVVKSNALIQRSRFTLSAQEQKIILFLISKIKPDDTEFCEHIFDIADFCKVCGIDYENGKNYENLKSSIKTLADKSVWVAIDEKQEILIRWINAAVVDKGTGKIRLKLEDNLKPYLLQLKKQFTQYELYYVLAMKSQYSLRLYEILRSYEHEHKPISIDIDDLKRKLFAENYIRFPDFKRYVLDIAIREINALSDIKVSFETEKESRRFATIVFSVEIKKDLNERLNTWQNIERVLESEKHAD
jgi:plasmid replication initiation protein